MLLVPQVEPVTTFTRNPAAIFERASNGPIYLTQYGQGRAVLVSTQQWAEISAEMERLRRLLEGDRQLAAARAGDYVDLDDLDSALAA
jgi:PHD/YefM family antitoxin component YafN of YafNO toxin-antitoxin module